MWVAAVALVNGVSQVLVQRRPAGSQHAHLWEFPGGKLEAGETPAQAAVRELHEELAVSIRPIDLRPVCFACSMTEISREDRSPVLLLFACHHWEGEPRPLADTQLAWCEPRELKQWAMPPLDYPLAHALAKMIDEDAI
jgi:8-oxo-dGTP diphosphatase